MSGIRARIQRAANREQILAVFNQKVLSILLVVAILVVFAAYLNYAVAPTPSGTSTTSSSSETTSQAISGIVTGLVTVGPSQPVCTANQSCNVNLTGYSLIFTRQCPNLSPSCQVQTFLAPIYSSGHYSILLPAGNYTVSGISPSCQWMGCSSQFPKSIAVEGGMQLEFDVSIDTGIR
ncbi:MAG: hypothetical protein ACYCPP_05800 [Nitrososphaerales archaeon]